MLVKMISGTFGYREKTEDGYSLHVVCKSRVDPPFEVDETVGADLLERGVAVLVEPNVPGGDSVGGERVAASVDVSTPNEPENAAESDEEGEEAVSAPEYSVDMKADQLRAIMEANGLTVKPRMTKREMVDALDAFFASDEEDEDDELPPDLDAEVPVG